MPLLAFWSSNPAAVAQLSIEQVVSSAGDGAIKDGSVCSQELRKYFTEIPSVKLASYVEHCLYSGFARSGLVLQDLINELGRRLDYSVTNGRYQGTSSTIGFDGIWVSPEGHTIIAEVKTTDAYRISLETIATYRDRLLASGQIHSPVSALIVVGREDTGELEAQVRGSRHAWDIRLISADALIKLVQLKENSEIPETGQKIRSILAPMEYTRLDKMIDVVFATARDVETTAAVEEAEDESDDSETAEKEKGTWQFTDSKLLQKKREAIIAAFGRARGVTLVQRSRALLWDSEHLTRVACTISKRYERQGSYRYWFAFHPQWDDFLRDGKDSSLLLGCMDLGFAFAIPWRVIHESLGSLNTTTTKDGHTYWHVHIMEDPTGRYAMPLSKKSTTLPLDEFRLALDNSVAER